MDNYLCNDDLEELGLDNIQKKLVRRRNTFLPSDPQFGIDIMVLAMLGGEAGIARVKELLLEALDNNDGVDAFSQTLQAIESISKVEVCSLRRQTPIHDWNQVFAT